MPDRPSAKTFHTGGAVNTSRSVYVERPEDAVFLRILRQGEHCNLHAGRQSGKTSLMVKAIQALQREGHVCVAEELSFFISRASVQDVLSGLCASVRESIPSFSFIPSGTDLERDFYAFCRALAAHAPPDGRLYLFLDELDALRRFPQKDCAQFFLGLRKFVNEQANPESGLSNVCIILISVLTPNQFFMDEEVGGVGASIARDLFLAPFPANLETAAMLTSGFPRTTRRTPGLLVNVLEYSGGQPYLTALLCSELAATSAPAKRFNELRKEIERNPQTLLDGHFEGMRKQLLDHHQAIYAIAQAYKAIHAAPRRREEYPGASEVLQNIGLVRVDINGLLDVANPIYRTRISPEFIDEILDAHDAKAQRERQTAPSASGKRVLVIFTGGTIGMALRDGKAEFLTPNEAYWDMLPRSFKSMARLTPMFLTLKDGIDVTPEYWENIVEVIVRNYQEYDAFIIAHGTDTLAFSASASAFAFGPDLDKPVVFTGAQTTIDVTHGDTALNLARSCFLATHESGALIKEVVVCFGDKVLRACRAIKTDDYRFDGFDSLAWPPLARIAERIIVNKSALLPKSRPFYPESVKSGFATAIMTLNIVPGLRPALFQPALDRAKEGTLALDGVILVTPGAGNIPSEKYYNFREFIREATDAGIPALITSQVPISVTTPAQYEAATAPMRYGAIPSGNMTLPAAVAKFSWAIAQAKRESGASAKSKVDGVRKTMGTNLVGEIGEYESPDASWVFKEE